MTFCPTCGQQLAAINLRIDLDHNLIVRGDAVVAVSAQQAELMFAIARNGPRLTSLDAISAALWGMRDGPEDGSKTISVQLCHLRKAISPLGVEIVNHPGRGYSLKLNAMEMSACRA